MQDSPLSKSAARSHHSQSRSAVAMRAPLNVAASQGPGLAGCEKAKYQIRAKKGFLVAKNTTSGLVLLVYSQEYQLGVLLHLPTCSVPANSKIDQQNRLFSKSAIHLILAEFEALGVPRKGLMTYVIGGSATHQQPAVSKVSVQRTLWNHGLTMTACDLGGKQMRSIWMDMESGRTIIRSEPLQAEDLSAGSPLLAAS